MVTSVAQALLPDPLHKYYEMARNPVGLPAAGPTLRLAAASTVIVFCLIATTASQLIRTNRRGSGQGTVKCNETHAWWINLTR
jgi:hypothetical protein